MNWDMKSIQNLDRDVNLRNELGNRADRDINESGPSEEWKVLSKILQTLEIIVIISYIIVISLQHDQDGVVKNYVNEEALYSLYNNSVQKKVLISVPCSYGHFQTFFCCFLHLLYEGSYKRGFFSTSNVDYDRYYQCERNLTSDIRC